MSSRNRKRRQAARAPAGSGGSTRAVRGVPAAATRVASRVALLLLVVATLVAYSGVGGLGFVSFDDPQYLADNEVVLRGLSLDGLRYALLTTELGNWDPLVPLSHMLVVQLFGAEPGAHHQVNLLLHLACVVLLFRLLTGLTGQVWPSAFATGLFALHPLHVESVAWIAERKDVLSTAFWLATLLAWTRWVRERRPRWAFATLLAFAAGLMSKPMLVSLPLTLLLLDLWPLRRWRGVAPEGGLSAARLVAEKLPLFALAAASAGITILAQRSAGALASASELDIASRCLNALRSLGVYLLQTIRPTDLAVFYPYPSEVPRLQAAAAALVVVSVSAGALALVRRAPFVLVGWAWFLVTLLPVLGLVQVGLQAHADRYTYVPHIGLFVALAWGLDGLVAPAAWRRKLLVATAVTALGACLLLTRRQVRVWSDDETLFAHAAESTDCNYLALDYLGRALNNQGRFAEAAEHLRAAIECRPEFASAQVNLGLALEGQGRLEEAVERYREAIALEPGQVFAYGNLGSALARLRRTDEAAEVLERALALDPTAAGVRMNAVLNDLVRGETARAVEQFRIALRHDGDLIAHPQALFLAWTLATSPDPACRDGALAVRVAEEAARRSGRRDPMALEALAAGLAESGRFDEASRVADEALALPGIGGQPEFVARLREAAALYAAERPYRAAEAR